MENYKPSGGGAWLGILVVGVAAALALPFLLRDKAAPEATIRNSGILKLTPGQVDTLLDELKFEHGRELMKARHEAFWLGVKAAQTAATNSNFRITEVHERLIGLRP